VCTHINTAKKFPKHLFWDLDAFVKLMMRKVRLLSFPGDYLRIEFDLWLYRRSYQGYWRKEY